jgi:hypothetical protein
MPGDASHLEYRAFISPATLLPRPAFQLALAIAMVVSGFGGGLLVAWLLGAI